MRRFRVLFIAIVSVGLVAFFFVESRGVDRMEHSRGDIAISAVRGAIGELDRQILLARNEPARAKERLEEALGRTTEVFGALERSINLAGKDECQAKIALIRSALQSLPTRVSAIGSAAQGWAEGVRALPSRTAAVQQAGKLDSETATALYVVLSEVAALQLSVVSEPGQEMTSSLAHLREKAKLNPRLAPSLQAVLTTVDDLLAHKRTLEAELSGLSGPDLTRSCNELHAAFESWFDAQLENAEHFRIGLYVFTIALLGRLLQIMFELRKRTRELDDANRTLEERVNERTLKLSAANLALKVEIVERERAEIESQRALAQAEAASRTKSEFLANTSHEIRTPMTSILGFSERLLDPTLSDGDKVEAISRIRRNGEHLLQIINDILDISKIEAGMLALEKIPCSPHEILAEVHGAMDVRAAIAGIELKVESIGGIPETIRTDPVRLKQILINLVGNAIKFTQRGWVRLLVTLETGEKSRLRFAVMDTGIGMDSETVARLFRPFMQADSSTTRKFGGTGLGLSICKHLVERLGGVIEVTSEPGKGTVFTFSIETGPLEGVKMLRGQNISFLADFSDSDAHFETPRLAGARILLVEDGEDNRRLIGFILAAAQAQVDVAVDGGEALARVAAAEAASQPYHIVVMDMQMPVLDGYEATRRLRGQNCQSAIVALTAHAMAADRDRCLEAGCDDFCTKPIVRPQFLGTIASWYQKKRGDEPRIEASEQPAGSPVATIDESQIDAELIELVRLFVSDLDTDVKDMRAALDANDLAGLAVIAHRLKGAAGSYGFPSLTTHAGILEKHAKSGAPREELERDLDAVRRLCTAAASEKGLK